MWSSGLVAAVASPPAGGATTAQVVLGSLGAGLVTAVLLALGSGHRSGRLRTLERAGSWIGRRSGLPGWAALPAAVSLFAFLVAGPGFVWDVALHIDRGRDPGPFANPSHYCLIVGTLGFLSAGFLAVVMPKGDAIPSGVRFARDWQVPAGAIAMLAAGTVSVLGFPLDDVWHRLFGQDVTLWGPTHLMMITGGLLHFCGLMVLVREGRSAAHSSRPARPKRSRMREWRARALLWANGVVGCTVVLVGFSIAYQQEFDYGIPQFRLLFQPTLIAFTAALALVAARVALGRGGALATVGAYLGVQGFLAVLVGPVLGEVTLHFPLYVAEALVVEVAGMLLLRRGAYAFALGAGVLVATVGVLAEWGWSHVWMPTPWPAHLVGEAMLRSIPVAVGGGLIGAFGAMCLRRRTEPLVLAPRAWVVPAAAIAAVLISLGSLLPTHSPRARASVVLTDVRTGADRTVNATVRFSPAYAADGADWLQGVAWQGHGHLVSAPLRRIAEGVYRTTKPLPVHGQWKATIRLHRGSEMGALAVYFPDDPAIPVRGVPATARFDRPLVHDRVLLQRERKPGIAAWMWPAASSLVLAMVLGLLAVLCWALLRFARASASATPRPGARAATAR
jgi:hypothetical protein